MLALFEIYNIFAISSNKVKRAFTVLFFGTVFLSLYELKIALFTNFYNSLKIFWFISFRASFTIVFISCSLSSLVARSKITL